ncbi:MAG: hypothetical protein ACE5FF_02925 [Saprospiraceae bacterium]
MKYFAFFALVLFLACKNKPQEPAAAAAAPALPEGFTEFYRRFHADSVYQMAHIVFPLQGLPGNADSLTIAQDNYHWQPENWKMMRPFDFQMSDFRRELHPVNENMVVERIVHKSGEFGMVRRFAKVAGEWNLIYYTGMNRLAK